MSPIYSQAYSRSYFPPAPVASVTIYNVEQKALNEPIEALIDTGSDASMMPLSKLHQVQATYLRNRQMRWGTHPPQSVPVYLIGLKIGLHDIHGVKAIGLPEQTEIILGRDVLNQLDIHLNGLALETIIQS